MNWRAPSTEQALLMLGEVLDDESKGLTAWKGVLDAQDAQCCFCFQGSFHLWGSCN
jgi:hypothetical protein